jgi:hypothetical protein
LITTALTDDVLYNGAANVAFESIHECEGLNIMAFLLELLPPMKIALLSVHCINKGDIAGGATAS